MNKLVRLALVLVLSAFWSWVASLFVLWAFIRKGPRWLFYRQERKSPPPALTDPAFKHAFVQLSQVKLHYAYTGDQSKPLMLFLHGYPEFWYSWRHQLRHFSNDYWCVAVDMRGYNLSDKPRGIANYHLNHLTGDIAEVVEKLGKQSCVLVAHDWGALVAWCTAHLYPHVVDKLVICNVPHPYAFIQHIFSSYTQFFKSWYTFAFQCPFLPEFMVRIHDYETLENCFTKKPMGIKQRGAFTQNDIEAWKYAYSQSNAITGPINYYRAFWQLDEVQLPKEKIQAPTVIIWGTEDGALDTVTAWMSTYYCEKCTVKYVEGASHWVQQDEPDQVNFLINQFLTG